jgi:hypothetical protein
MVNKGKSVDKAWANLHFCLKEVVGSPPCSELATPSPRRTDCGKKGQKGEPFFFVSMLVSDAGDVLYGRMRAASEGKKSKRKEKQKKLSESFPRPEEKWMNDLRLLARFIVYADALIPLSEQSRSSPLGPGDSPVAICVQTHCTRMTCMTSGVACSPGWMDVVPADDVFRDVICPKATYRRTAALVIRVELCLHFSIRA